METACTRSRHSRLCFKLTVKDCILLLLQPPTACQGARRSVHGLRGLLVFRGLVSFIFPLWHEGMGSDKKKISNLLCGNVTSTGCPWSTLFQHIALADPCQHPTFLERCWLIACFPSECSKLSWPGKGTDLWSRTPPRAPKPKNKSKLLLTFSFFSTWNQFFPQYDKRDKNSLHFEAYSARKVHSSWSYQVTFCSSVIITAFQS